MCGIIGIAAVEPVQDRKFLALGRDTMSHRGPNDAGEWWSSDDRVGFGHRRLSIIDLSPLGHQPMHSSEFGLTIIFNGEIYNYRELRKELIGLDFVFRSSSDTEVLLMAYVAWGEACLSRLNGMFAFAIYDAANQKLFMARDRAGEKPLFYRVNKKSIIFASELKALLANPENPRQIDHESLDCYLASGYVPGFRCILQGYNKLPAAHALRFDLQSGQYEIWSYWQLPDIGSPQGRVDEAALLEELENILEDSVRLQMVSDVPVGILLSGGVDSSLITTMASRFTSQVQTFTVGLPSHEKLNEFDHARLIARHFGTHHTELVADEVDASLLPILARQFDEPMSDSSMIPTFLVSELVKKRCTVALGGDGGDELFGGYDHYSRLQFMKPVLSSIPSPIRKSIALAAEHVLPLGIKGRNWLQNLSADLTESLPLIASRFDRTSRMRLLVNQQKFPLVAESILMSRIPSKSDLLQRSTHVDFSNYLVDDILVKVDRTSMLNSLELRSPFLDYRLIDFSYEKIPSHLKATAKDKKILLKRLASRLLPLEFDRKRKQGFSIPLREWLNRGGSFGPFFNDVLRDPQCSFDPSMIDSLLRGHVLGRRNEERLFTLVMFELWRREYGASF